ncbi:hypothetical protein P8452_44066 [Trifolium repens]|nr:hypothetical protein P8452_44066 [Trifolium repens]
MSSSSSRKINEDAQEAQGEVHLPRWLEEFLGQKSSDSCPAHLNRRNIYYCIKCEVSACQDCMSLGAHEDHQILQIRKYFYMDVVHLTDMQPYINCSQIQPFKANENQVLNCRPRCGSTLDDATSCNNSSIKSKIAKAYPYCSITCMVKAARKSSIPPIVSIQAPPPPPQESLGEISQHSKRKRKRKGTPQRAPFF